MGAILKDGRLRLSGAVGSNFEGIFEDGFTSDDVVLALSMAGDGDLIVHINSPGGYAFEGAAIHALLSARKGRTDVVVEGIAASAASLIAMAGKTVTMAAGAVMMIHDPSTITFGNSADHKKSVEVLEVLATAYARVYAAKSGKTAAACRAIMREENWFTPEQAVKEGFADATTEHGVPAPVAAFDYRIYARAPEHLVEMAISKNWTMQLKGPPPPEPSAPPAPPASKPPAPTPPADAAAIAEICLAGSRPELIPELLREGATREQATARVNLAGQIFEMVATARKISAAVPPELAVELVRKGLTVAGAREWILGLLVKNQSPEIDPHLPLPRQREGLLVAEMRRRVAAAAR